MADLEVCVDSIESAIAAAKGGAARLELCSALSEGGLTPSPGFLRTLKEDIKMRIPIYCLLRPRSGDFVYNDFEIKQILYDLHILKNIGCDGFVFGALDSNQEINVELCEQIVDACGDLPITFHRAFDLTKYDDLIKNCKLLDSLGFKRILTSGLKQTAELGLSNLIKISKLYVGKLIIMPGAGITPCNLKKILLETNFKEFHASAKRKKICHENKIKMGNDDSNDIWVTDDNIVRELVNIGQEITL